MTDRLRRPRPSGAGRLLAGATLAAGVGLAALGCTTPRDAQASHGDPAATTAPAPADVRVVTVASGLANPWGMAFLPNGDVLVTEKPGRLRVVRGGTLQPTPIPGVPAVHAQGQGGLLDVALHPRFAENRLVYLSYSKPGPQGSTTAVARGRLDGDRLVDVRDVFVADAWSRRDQHYGSRIVFDRGGLMYVSVGERNEKTPAQDVGNHKGTVLRLHDDGRVPADNPFVNRAGARPEIFSYGHRNVQGMALHPTTGALWANEHGARGGDEINVLRAGRNYGWPRITHGVDYGGGRISADTALAGMEQPLLHWTPSIAPSGMAFYTADRFPQWRGSVLVGALAGQQLRRVELDGERVVRQETLLQGRARVRAVTVGPDGYVYLLTDASNGALLRLEPAAP